MTGMGAFAGAFAANIVNQQNQARGTRPMGSSSHTITAGREREISDNAPAEGFDCSSLGCVDIGVGIQHHPMCGFTQAQVDEAEPPLSPEEEEEMAARYDPVAQTEQIAAARVEEPTETHYIFYDEGTDAGYSRQYWECTVCSRGGSVSYHGDPEQAAEDAHARDGITALGPHIEEAHMMAKHHAHTGLGIDTTSLQTVISSRRRLAGVDYVCPFPPSEHTRDFVASFDGAKDEWTCYEHGHRLVAP